ncbi:MAG: NAD(P)/FAD-dependent oxidoreductase [Candidatus Puniceispirillaceae bacterium]
MTHYIVIGASHAGISFAEKMRQQGCDDKITIIDRLSGIPLQRPPLSKAYLGAEAAEEEAFYLRGAEWFETQSVTLRDGVCVEAINRQAKTISLGDGSELSYDKLILALGAVPRMLPMAEEGVKNLFVLRDADDARQLKAAMQKAQKAVVIGGGYIGLEAAASLRKQGLEVEVIEAAPRLLARVGSPPISAAYQALHESHGVTIRQGVGVDDLNVQDGAIAGVRLSSGEQISCDLLLVGIGVIPETKLAEEAGLTVGNGIITSYDYQTNDADIYAIGDNVLAQGRGQIRIESIHNAQYGAHYLASQFNEAPPPHEEAPWFWSDLYDRKLQSAGLVPPEGDDVVYVRRPGKREGGLSVWSYRASQLMAVESMNDPQAYMIGKLCLERGISPDQNDIGNPEFDLKTLR